MPDRTIRGYGWKPSLPDHRDLVADASELKVAPEVDPRSEMPPVYDQGSLGSCTANAVARAIQYDNILDGDDRAGRPSRLGIYWLERFLEGGLSNTKEDTGAFGRDGFKAARQWGYVPETDLPYEIPRFADDPRNVLTGPDTRKLRKDYRAVRRTVGDFKRVLSNRQTVAFGFSVYESFESYDVSSSGVVPHPDPGESLLGGHEVLMVGYLRSEPGYALCANSWGVPWGMGGYFLMPWSIILDGNLSGDFRTIRRPL